jgi:hypothetical protein
MKTFTLPEIISLLSKHPFLHECNSRLRRMAIEMIDNGTAIVEDAKWADDWRTIHSEYYPLPEFKKQSWTGMDGYFEVRHNNQLLLIITVYEKTSNYDRVPTNSYVLTINDTHPTIQALVEQKVMELARKAIDKENAEKARKRQQAMEQSIIDNLI